MAIKIEGLKKRSDIDQDLTAQKRKLVKQQIKLLLMTERMYDSEIMTQRRGYKGLIKQLATIKLTEIEEQKKQDNDDLLIVGHNLKLQTIQDERNIQYFMNLLTRRSKAV